MKKEKFCKLNFLYPSFLLWPLQHSISFFSITIEFENSIARIDESDHSNYYFWKARIEYLRILKDPANGNDSTAVSLWDKKDDKAQAIIGHSLSNDLLENVRVVETTKEMWMAIRNVFELHRVLKNFQLGRNYILQVWILTSPFFNSPIEFVKSPLLSNPWI